MCMEVAITERRYHQFIIQAQLIVCVEAEGTCAFDREGNWKTQKNRPPEHSPCRFLEYLDVLSEQVKTDLSQNVLKAI